MQDHKRDTCLYSTGGVSCVKSLVVVQDMKENMFAETEPAQALKEIRFRDPSFDMVKFLYNLKVDVPIVIQAYLRCQIDVLKQHCSADMVERLSGIIAAQQAQVSFSCTPYYPMLKSLQGGLSACNPCNMTYLTVMFLIAARLH